MGLDLEYIEWIFPNGQKDNISLLSKINYICRPKSGYEIFTHKTQ